MVFELTLINSQEQPSRKSNPLARATLSQEQPCSAYVKASLWSVTYCTFSKQGSFW